MPKRNDGKKGNPQNRLAGDDDRLNMQFALLDRKMLIMLD